VDLSLAEKAADKRGSTPTHAAEILSPDRRQLKKDLIYQGEQLDKLIDSNLKAFFDVLTQAKTETDNLISDFLNNLADLVRQNKLLLDILSPLSALKRGYAIIRQDGNVLTAAKGLRAGSYISTEFKDGEVTSLVKEVKLK
jgi:exodeoxyribonuclease VII large subunit